MTQSRYPSKRADITLLNYKLPVVFVGKHCVGEENDVQSLIDSGLLEEIIDDGKSRSDQEHTRICLLCRARRESVEQFICEECGEPFTFFVRSY